jgi:uncharacterized membrane protein YeaQ/YmgE (transglycosylase-associated protein family)
MSDLLVNLIIQVIAGAFGGILAGGVLKNHNLGTTGNTIAGAVGGGVGGYILQLLVPALQNAASALDWVAFLGLVAGSTAAGAIITLVSAVVRDRTA